MASPVPQLALGAVTPEGGGKPAVSAASDRVSAALGALGDVSRPQASTLRPRVRHPLLRSRGIKNGSLLHRS